MNITIFSDIMISALGMKEKQKSFVIEQISLIDSLILTMSVK